jgi:hypothetical protein
MNKAELNAVPKMLQVDPEKGVSPTNWPFLESRETRRDHLIQPHGLR